MLGPLVLCQNWIRGYNKHIVSSAYVVFSPKNPDKLPSEYLCCLLKTEEDLKIIRAYDTRHGAVRANLNWGQLCRIRIVIPDDAELKMFAEIIKQEHRLKQELSVNKQRMYEAINMIY